MSVIIIGILVFMLLVLIHELGHFIAAKRSGVKVLEFGIGLPPKVCKLRKDKSGTEYTLNLLPLGGFVRLKGEDPDVQEDFHAKDSFIKAKIWKKLIILLAGVTSNVILARALFTIIFAAGTRPIVVVSENSIQGRHMSYLFPTKTFLYQKGYITDVVKTQIENIPVVIEDLQSGSLASTLGIQTGDKILSLNATPINAWNIDNILKNISGDILALAVERKGKMFQFTGICETKDCALGIAYSGVDTSELGIFKNQKIKFSLGKSMIVSVNEIVSETKSTFSILGTIGGSLISFQRTKISKELNKMTGPVGAIKIGGMLYDQGGWTFFIAFAAMISLALAVFNVLPIPALDGGRLLGVLIQWIGKLKPEKYFTIESYINMIFFILLMALGVYIILKDLVTFRAVKIPFLS